MRQRTWPDGVGEDYELYADLCYALEHTHKNKMRGMAKELVKEYEKKYTLERVLELLAIAEKNL